MKTQTFFKLLTGILILGYTIILLDMNGVKKYQCAKFEIMQTDCTDSDIENTLYQYGFNLAWYEQPTLIDFIFSNFK